MSASNLPVDCPNCGTPFAGDYCHTCGQKRAPINPTVTELFAELAESVTSVDGKLLQSIALLLRYPGRLTKELFAGRRASYVTPLRLYLTFSVLYFALAAVSPRPVIDVRVSDRQASNGWTFNMSAPGMERPREQLSEAGQEMQRDFERRANEAFVAWIPRLMFVLVPLFAGLIALTMWRSGRNYPQHLYLALHIHAVWFFVGAVATAARLLRSPALSSIVAVLALAYATTYFVLALKRTYGLSMPGALWRAAGVGLVYLVIVVSTMLGVTLPIILRE